MKIIHSGFDTLTFAVKGAASPKSLKLMEHAKEMANKKQSDFPISFQNGNLKGMIAEKGQSGGYAYVLKFREKLGHVISIKRNIGLSQWNGMVKIRALALACFGWEKAVKNVFEDLLNIEFSPHGVSLSRVDYAIDFLNANIQLNPADFVAHSRTGKKANNMTCDTLTRGQTCESVTIGKMPNRQTIVYDKRAEVISKRSLAWFEIWGIDKTDWSKTVHRVEIRAGKTHLQKNEIRTFDDFRNKLKDMFTRDVQAIRYVQHVENDKNISRWPNHPTWDHVQDHVENHMFIKSSHVDVEAVKHVVKEQKIHMHTANALGNLAPVSVYLEMDPDHMVEQMVTYVQECFENVEVDDRHSFWKARNRHMI